MWKLKTKAMEKPILTAPQLFLLCNIRKGQGVWATNKQDYSWTCTHDNAFQERVHQKLKSTENTGDRELKIGLIKEEIIAEIPIEKPKLRCFITYETDFGFSLCDSDADASWYMPKMHGENDWDYKGFFELQEPLSLSEKFLLFTFLKIDDDPLVK